MSETRIVLASASPRRRELLRALGIEASVLPMDVDERVLPGEAAAMYVSRVAASKRDAAMLKTDLPVLAGDTSVVRDGVVLGKPDDEGHAIDMLTSLVGRTHQVMTAVAVGHGDARADVLVTTDVEFRDATLHEIERYARTGEGRDKAGAYAIQGIGAGFVRAIHGSYGAVVGLPQVETLELLRRIGVLGEWP